MMIDEHAIARLAGRDDAFMDTEEMAKLIAMALRDDEDLQDEGFRVSSYKDEVRIERDDHGFSLSVTKWIRRK